MDLTRVGVLAILSNLAVLIFLLLVFIPLPACCNWALLNWSHLSVLCFFTVPFSAFLALLFFRRVSYGKRFLFCFAGLVVLYALFFFGVHFEEDSGIKFDWFVSLIGMVPSWVLAAVPFLWKTRTSIISAIESKRVEYALLTASVMWMSPFLAELLVLLDWQTKGVFAEKVEHFVLGGAGLNDLLFILGFATFISTGLYALLAKKIRLAVL